MKKKILIALAALIVAVIAARPYVAVVADPDFGLAVSVRSTVYEKFEPLFIWRFAEW